LLLLLLLLVVLLLLLLPPPPKTHRYGNDQVPEGDDRTISNLLLDQIEFADVILLNKTDLLEPLSSSAAAATPNGKADKKQSGKAAAAAAAPGGVVSKLVDMLHQLNPRAKVVPTSRCSVELRDVLLTGMFDMDQVGSTQQLEGGAGGGDSLIQMQIITGATSNDCLTRLGSSKRSPSKATNCMMSCGMSCSLECSQNGKYLQQVACFQGWDGT
jgi:G3E family GTPase